MLLPLLLVGLMVRIPWPDISIPWPDWDLPSIPWPNIPWPSIPWPDWDLPELPAWLRALLEKAKYVWPVVLAFGLAHAEVKRRRRQDERRRQAPAGAVEEPDAPVDAEKKGSALGTRDTGRPGSGPARNDEP